MSASTRSGKLFAALTAKERAILVLRAWKGGREPDPQIKATLPNDQITEYNGLIDLMNEVHGSVSPFVLRIRAQVEQLGMLEGWIFTLMAWGLQTFDLAVHIFTEEPEPITQSEYDGLKRSSRKKEPRPDWGLHYEVLPDEKATEVERRRKRRERIREKIRDVPWSPDREMFDPEADGDSDETVHAILVRRLGERFQVCWSEMLSAETLLAEAAVWFDGEEPTLPPFRESLDWMRLELSEIHANLKARHLHETALPDRDETMLDAMRQVIPWPNGSSGSREVHVNLDLAPSGEVEDQPDHDPEAAPDDAE